LIAEMATFKLATAAALIFGQATASPQSQMFEKRQVGGEEPDVIVPGASSYNCDVNESLLLTTAQDMIDFGLRDLGYNYIVLDDCWSVGSK
jgi:alpha-galactosidase